MFPLGTRRLRQWLLVALPIAVAIGAAQTADAVVIEIQGGLPRLESLSATIPTEGGEVPVSLVLGYDAAGKLVCAAGSSLDGAEATCTGSAKLAGSLLGYKVTASGGGATVKIAGAYTPGGNGVSTGSLKYTGPRGKTSVSHDITVTALDNPVTSISLDASVSDVGAVSGSGTIASGFGNDPAGGGTLAGSDKGGKVSWALIQGTRKVSFKGTSTSDTDPAVGTLKVKAAPVKGTYGGFPVHSLRKPPIVVSGRVSTSMEGAALPGPPEPAVGAKVSVRSDLNGDLQFTGSEIAETTTNQLGAYTVPFHSGSRPVLVEFELPGYAAPPRVFETIEAGAAVQVDAVLKPLDILTVSNGKAVSADGKLEITGLPAGVTAVSGRVFNPVSEAAQFPGEFADSQGNLLVSSVFSRIEAVNATGQRVTELAAQTRLRMLVPRETWETMSDLHPVTDRIDVPLYSFDETDGQWKRAASDGWLEDSAGALIPESQRAAIHDGSYAGAVYAAGPVAHLSYWNVDWPIDTHGCVHGTVRDSAGDPVEGAAVGVAGATYSGRSSVGITGADGSFCADVMRSEGAGEDVDGDGVTGETQQVRVEVVKDGKFYRFGPFDVPVPSASCGTSDCLELSGIDLTPANEVQITLCTFSGQVVFSGTSVSGISPLAPGDPVPYPYVFGLDETVPIEFWLDCQQQGTCSPSGLGDITGAFTLTVPVLNGINVFAYTDDLDPGNSVFSFYVGLGGVILCPVKPVQVPADYYSFTTLALSLTSPDPDVSGYCTAVNDVMTCALFQGFDKAWYAFGTGIVDPPVAAGAWATLDLYDLTGGQVNPIGTMSLAVGQIDPPLTGTWTATGTGVNLSGDWMDSGFAKNATRTGDRSELPARVLDTLRRSGRLHVVPPAAPSQ